jgi:hypothetical protein
MGEFQAGKMLIGLSIYFIILIFSLFLVETFSIENGLDYSVTTTGNELSLLSYDSDYGVCIEPRTVIDSDSREEDTISIFSKNSADCKFTSGNFDELTCNQIDGCNWEALPTFWWFDNTNVFECTGTVNTTTLGLAGNELNVYGEISLLKEINEITNKEDSQIACETFGYSWNSEFDDTDIGFASIGAIVGSLFTYQASFTDDFFVDLLLTTALFYIQFIMLLIALYFALPFLH